jgi:glyoxylase-like metal-dependent hydrolase (beta-lactamase superfamily II)
LLKLNANGGAIAMKPILLLMFTTLVINCAMPSQEVKQAPQAGVVPAIPPEKGYFVQEIRGGLYWVTDGLYNTMFLVSSTGVIAVDPLPNLGEKYLKAISEVTDKPITHVIYSHEHTDHIGAAYLFPRNAVYIAQKQTAEILKRRNDARRPVPSVTFDDTYTVTQGDQTLVLDYKGINHEAGNIFIYAPRQKVLMLVDVVYPGWMPYKNLGIAEDIPGYIQAHRDALGFDFDTLVAGHVDRLGTRADVETSLEFVDELRNTMIAQMAKLQFPDYLRQNASSKHRWDRHNDYELALVEQCYRQLFPKWNARLRGSETYLKDDCWQMLESIAVQFAGEIPARR